MATIHRKHIFVGTPEEKRKYTTTQKNEYKRKTQRIYLLNIHKKLDKDIVDWLEENKPYSNAIKWLIEEQIKREREEKLSNQ